MEAAENDGVWKVRERLFNKRLDTWGYFSCKNLTVQLISLLTQGLAGIQLIDVPGIQNVDVTELIDGHSSYLWATPRILEQLELDTYFPVFSSSLVKSC
ncbi:hypothetical protein QJS04_geneDACA013235 [Acorus gramineus]|uniref:GPN-loop GTPase 2 n=1 Tax=Acorus gramineus TaxID=55184 RepID=A0AAV9B882_ACOGR|nr:hypothetical protein QJS04_geneDACA013235 [Acorus gramineus]